MSTTILKFNSLHGKLDRLAKKNQKVFQESVQKWMAFTNKKIQEDLKNVFKKDIAAEVIDWQFLQKEGEKTMKPAVLRVMQSGGDAAYATLKIEGSFDLLNPKSVEAANKFTAKLVTEVNDQTQKGIRIYIADGVKQGKSIPKIGRELRPIIGLTERQSQSIVNYRKSLSNKDKFPNLTAKDIDKRANRRAAKAHRQRTESIARTETARAQNIGYSQGMEELGVKELEFSIFDDAETSSECRGLNENRFPPSEAAGIIPVHPNCRCVMLPVIEDETLTTV